MASELSRTARPRIPDGYVNPGQRKSDGGHHSTYIHTPIHLVIHPFLIGIGSRIHAAIFSFCLGVITPVAISGKSGLYVQRDRVA